MLVTPVLNSRLRREDSGKQALLADRKPRRTVTMSGFGALTSGATFALTVLDLSYDGCKIETGIALLPGVAVKVSIVKLGVIDAEVRWSAGGCAGLSFAVAAAPEQQTPRSATRLAIAAEALLRRPGQTSYRVRISDLTCKGCKIEFVERPRMDEIHWVKFEGMDSLEAKVRWVDGHWGGLEFARAIHPAVFDLLLARLNPQAS